MDEEISTNEGGQGNPAWNDLLADIPADLHEKVTPHLQKWDTGVQQRFDGINSKYAPFQEFLDNEVDPEHLRMGLGLITSIQEDPRGFWDTMAQNFGFSANGDTIDPSPSDSNGGSAEEDLANIPPAVLERMQKLETGYEAIAKELLAERESKAKAAQDSQLEKTLADLKSKHGDFHEGFVLTAMHMGAKPDEAIKQWEQLKESILAENNRPKAPKILGGGGTGMPGETKVDVTKMNSKQTRQYVSRFLAERAASRE